MTGFEKKNKLLLYCHDGPVYRDKDGCFWDYSLSPRVLEQYFALAEQVRLLIRVKDKQEEQMFLLDREGLSVAALQNINSSFGMLRGFLQVREEIRKQVEEADYLVVRLPGVIGSLAARWAAHYHKPYLAECVSCPWDIYRYHSLTGRFAAPFFWLETRRDMALASHGLYVTGSFLQKRYPTRGKSLGCPDVVLPEICRETPVKYKRKAEEASPNSLLENESRSRLVLGTAGSVDAAFKGQQYVIYALAYLKKGGNDRFVYRLAGIGRGERLMNLARKLGVDKQVELCGCLAGDRLLAWYQELDLYIQPSLTEGMPRALLEAMAAGTAAIGSTRGGIPELLEESARFPAGMRGVRKLAKMLEDMDDRRLAERSALGIETASAYGYDRIRARRAAFYQDYAKEADG